MAKSIAGIRIPKDGEAGRDAAHLEILPAIDESRSYPSGTWAQHAGGLIKAARQTDAITEGLVAHAVATLAPRLRNQGTPIFSLLRNIGSSVGISIVQALLTEGSSAAHAQIATTVAPGNPALATLPSMMSPDNPLGLAMLNAEVTRQGALVGYLDDFAIMMVITLVAIPLLLLIRSPKRAAASGPAEVPH